MHAQIDSIDANGGHSGIWLVVPDPGARKVIYRVRHFLNRRESNKKEQFPKAKVYEYIRTIVALIWPPKRRSVGIRAETLGNTMLTKARSVRGVDDLDARYSKYSLPPQQDKSNAQCARWIAREIGFRRR